MRFREASPDNLISSQLFSVVLNITFNRSTLTGLSNTIPSAVQFCSVFQCRSSTSSTPFPLFISGCSDVRSFIKSAKRLPHPITWALSNQIEFCITITYFISFHLPSSSLDLHCSRAGYAIDCLELLAWSCRHR